MRVCACVFCSHACIRVCGFVWHVIPDVGHHISLCNSPDAKLYLSYYMYLQVYMDIAISAAEVHDGVNSISHTCGCL